MVGSGLTGQHENAGADHRTDPQHDQVLGGEGALQGGLALQAAFDRFAPSTCPAGSIGLTLNRDFSIRYIPKWQS